MYNNFYPNYLGLNNPMMPNNNQNTNNTFIPPQQVVKVSGENGARAYPMGANSSALLLDESGLIAWLVTTDGAGYKNTVAPYDLTPHQEKPPVDYSAVEDKINTVETNVKELVDNYGSRLQKVEQELGDLINELTGNTSTAK
jgi:hypothetical protein